MKKYLTEIRAVTALVTIVTAGLMLTMNTHRELINNLFTIGLSITIGLSGFDEIEKGKRATGWMLIILGAIFALIFGFRLFGGLLGFDVPPFMMG